MSKLYNALTTANHMGVSLLIAINPTAQDVKELIARYNETADTLCTRSSDIADAMGITMYKVSCETDEDVILDEVVECIAEHRVKGQPFVLCSDYPGLLLDELKSSMVMHVTQ